MSNPEPDTHRHLFTLPLFIAAGALAILLAFSRPLFMGEVYVEDDLAAYHLPMFKFYQDAVRNGDSFLWTPHILNGFYWHGEGQGGFTHPLYYLLSLLFPLDITATLHILLNYPMLFAGAWLFLRRWQVVPAAALFGALLFTFIGMNLNHYIHICLVAVFSHVFWQLYAIERAMTATHQRERIAMVFAVLTLSTSQLLLGSPQFTYYAWLCEMLYVLFRLRSTGAWRVMWALGAAKTLSFWVAAIQILPTAETLALSLRVDPNIEYQLVDSLHPLNLLQLLSPYLYHQRVLAVTVGDQPWDAPYLGAFVTVGMALLLLNLNALKQYRPLVLACFALVLLGWASSWGRYGFLYPLYDLIPVINKFRAPARYMAISHVGMAVLGALAFHLLSRGEALPARRIWPLIALPAASWAMALTLPWLKARQTGDVGPFFTYLQPFSSLAVGAALLTAATALVIAAARGQRLALWGLALLTFADIGLYSLRHKPSMPLEQFIAEVDVPTEAAPGARLDPDIHTFFMNRIAMRDFRGVYGYVSMFPERGLDYTQVLPLQLAGVSHRQARLLGTADIHEAKLAGKNWIPLEGTLPRARLLSEARVSKSAQTDIYTIDVTTTGLVEHALTLDDGAPGTAALTSDRPGDIRVATITSGRQLLVVSESWHPGWRAEMDGAPAEVVKVYGDFIGCVVEGGEHEVHLFFDPSSWRYGKWLSAASVLGCLGLWWAMRRWL